MFKITFRFFAFIFLLLPAANLNAQEWLNAPYFQNLNSDSTTAPNFYQIQNSIKLYQNTTYVDRDEDQAGDNGVEAEDGSEQLARWSWFNEQRVFPSGKFPSTDLVMHEFELFQQTKNTEAYRSGNPNALTSATWVNLANPIAPVGSSAGPGRINCIAFMPGNATTIFVGTACGGVWKSTDDGITWNVLNTDQLPSLSIASIAIDPINTNNIYIATGDNFAGIPGFGKSLQGHFSAGIFQSTNGGLTWSAVGPTYTQAQFSIPQQLIIDPINPTVLLLAGNTGILRSNNSGNTWTNVKPGNFYSIEFNPLNHNVAYATDGLGLWRSNNNGQTWQYKGGGYPNTTGSRVSFAVTPADTAYIYMWGPTAGFKKSINGGTTFTTMTNPDGMVSPYGYYDRAISVSKTNALEVIVGGQSSVKSLNGGSSWTVCSDYTNNLAANYTHQDIKRLAYAPNSGTKIYAMTDGGIFQTIDDGTNWSRISNGLQINEIYRLANHPQSADTILYGTQDCSSNRWIGSAASVTQVSGGDGMQPLYDYNNPQIQFVCKPYGNMQKSIDWGQSYSLASAGQASWVSSFVMNPVNPRTMYCGTWVGVKKSTDEGTFLSWNNTSSGIIDTVLCVAVTPCDTNYVFAAKFSKIVKSTDGGNTWTNITGTLPVNLAAIDYISVSPTDTDMIFVSFSGYAAGQKIYKTIDGGITWTNISGSLSNVPVNCIEYVNGSNDAVYIGTDFGVFYRDSAATDWTSYNTGLPNVIVNHLSIYYPTMKLRAATYGRGIWESDLIMPVSSYTAMPAAICSGDSISFTDQSSGNPTSWNWAFQNGSPAFSNQQNPVVTYNSAGTFNVSLTTSNVNGINTNTNTITVYPLPPVPIITQNIAVLTSSATSGNQWYLNNAIIPGATNQNYTVLQNGNYTVVVTDANGCTVTSAAFNFLSTGITELNSPENILVVPNPSSGNFQIIAGSSTAIFIYDTTGKLIFETKEANPHVNLSSQADGIYFIRVERNGNSYRKVLVIQ